MIALDARLLSQPLAHRGYHDLARGIPENSRAAFKAAIDAGYGIELDVQMSSDHRAMAFHDDDLDRLTPETGPIRSRPAEELAAIPLKGGSETIPTLREVLDLIAGQVPLLVEIKDQDGTLGPDVGLLEQALADDLQGYQGAVAVMSFNPHAVAAFAKAAPDIAVGLVTDPYFAEHWPNVPNDRLAELRAIPDYDRVGASFISHLQADLASPQVAKLKQQGAKILCWTVRSERQERVARKVADNITFESYAAALP